MDPKQRCVRTAPGAALAAAVCAAVMAATANDALADSSEPPVSIGAGVQSGFYSCTQSCLYSPGTPATPGGSVEGFALDSIRLYINGNVTDQIKMTFNTEYTGSGTGPGANKVEVMDAIGRFEFSDQVNIWAGRFLPPSDRANLYGPYFANDWTPYADGVADYYPTVALGRDNGVAYWGDFGMLKLQVGAFDGQSLGPTTAVADPAKVLYAGRVTLDFWDKESGYYLNSTYYGDKNVLALGMAGQTLDGKTTFNLDGLLDRKLPNGGVLTVESEYVHDNGLNALAASSGWYALGAYMFPQVIGIGKIQVLGKYSDKSYDAVAATTGTVTGTGPGTLLGTPSYTLKTTEVNLNYIIKEFSARVGFYFLTQKNDLPTVQSSLVSSPKEFGLKMQLQM